VTIKREKNETFLSDRGFYLQMYCNDYFANRVRIHGLDYRKVLLTFDCMKNDMLEAKKREWKKNRR
jgi:hypothetical protein